MFVVCLAYVSEDVPPFDSIVTPLDKSQRPATTKSPLLGKPFASSTPMFSRGAKDVDIDEEEEDEGEVSMLNRNGGAQRRKAATGTVTGHASLSARDPSWMCCVVGVRISSSHDNGALCFLTGAMLESVDRKTGRKKRGRQGMYPPPNSVHNVLHIQKNALCLAAAYIFF